LFLIKFILMASKFIPIVFLTIEEGIFPTRPVLSIISPGFPLVIFTV